MTLENAASSSEPMAEAENEQPCLSNELWINIFSVADFHELWACRMVRYLLAGRAVLKLTQPTSHTRSAPVFETS